MSVGPSFQGGVFHPKIPDGRSNATIELSYEGVVARTPDGDSFTVSFGDCQIEIGGASGKMVFCHNHDRSLTIYCEERPFLEALNRESRGMLTDRIDAVRQKKSSERRQAWVWSIVIILVLVAIGYGGFYGLRAAARASVRAMPRSFDEKLGETIFETMDLHGTKVTDPTVVDAVQSIVKKISEHTGVNGVNFKVTVVKADICNAFALPGGNIVVYTGLIERAERAEQIAGVLAHEMAHVTRRHSLQRISSSLGMFVMFQLFFGDVGGVTRIGAEILTDSAENHYSREQETEADLDGAETLHRAGIDPQGMAEFFEILHNEEGDLPNVLSWISTHPSHQDRVRAIRSHLEKLPKRDYSPLELNWQQVRERIQAL